MNRSRTTRALSRRSLLRGMAGGAALLPFVPLLERDAEAAGGVSKRIIVITHPNGNYLPEWRPNGGDELVLPSILEPLQPFAENLLVLDGLDNIAYEQNVVGDYHNGMGSLWTGMPCSDELQAGGLSVDQFIANGIGGESLLRSINAAAKLTAPAVRTRAHYRGVNDPVEPDQAPSDLFTRVFADSALDPAEFERLKAQRLSVLDAVSGDLDGLKAKMSGNDVRRMEQHHEGIRSIEQRLSIEPPSCTVPQVPPTLDPRDDSAYQQIMDLHVDLFVEAFACDVTRVATLQMGREGSTGGGGWVDGYSGSGIHTMSHGNDPESLENMRLFYRWNAETVARLVQKLADTPDVDGGSLLDNTLIVWGSAMSSGYNHASRNLPFVVVEGSNGYFRTGRHIRWGTWELGMPAHGDHGGEPHNRLLVSLCHAMGLTEQTSFGLEELGGGLPELV